MSANELLGWDAETIIRSYFSITDPSKPESLEAFCNFFDDSAVMELPYRPAPGARRYEGLAVLREIIWLYPKIYRQLNNLDVRVHQGVDPLEAFAFWSIDHELLNGYRYKNDYLGHFRFTQSGKFEHVREFYDPARVGRLYADNPDIYSENLWSSSMGHTSA